MVSLFQKLKNIQYSSLYRAGMGKNRVFTVCIISLVVASIIVAIPSMIILILAKVSAESPRVFHASVQENSSAQLNFNVEDCPKVSYFYKHPAQQRLYLRVYTDPRAVAGLSLSFYSGENSGIFLGRFALCYAVPSSSCEIRIPKNTHFIAVVSADSDNNDEVSTVLFRWECYYATNDPLITASVFFGVSIGVLLFIGICWNLRHSLVELVVGTENRIHKWLEKVESRAQREELKTPQQYVFEDLTLSSHS